MVEHSSCFFALQDRYRVFNKPMWVTEIACSDPASPERLNAAGQMAYMKDMLLRALIYGVKPPILGEGSLGAGSGRVLGLLGMYIHTYVKDMTLYIYIYVYIYI